METNALPNNKLRGALTRGLVALLVAIFLLIATNFAFIDILRGPEKLGPISQEDPGSYVSAEVSLIMDFYAEDYSSLRDSVTGWYAIVPHEGQLFTILLTPRYFESAGLVIDDTYSYLNRLINRIDKYFVVNGTLDNLDPKAQAMLYDWFSLNKGWMAEAGIIGEVTDYSHILSPYVLCVDTVGSLPAVWAFALTGAALLCLVYVLIIFVRCALGKYGGKPEDAAEFDGDEPAASRTLPYDTPGMEEFSPDSGEAGK
ncbi:MAG TPA: hypothetical protein GXZ52_04205 [Clostridiales bacterium]|jgi:hypothetical protein|nr:hypothetical protein [Clostridiales bacterium]